MKTYADLYATGSQTPLSYRNLVRVRINRALRRYGLPLPGSATADKFALLGNRSSLPDTAPAPTLF